MKIIEIRNKKNHGMCLRPSLDFLFFRFEEEDFVGIQGKKYQAIFILESAQFPETYPARIIPSLKYVKCHFCTSTWTEGIPMGCMEQAWPCAS